LFALRIKETSYFYDDRDLLPNGKHCFPIKNCGNLALTQSYYYDLRRFKEKYYINTVSKQISGLYYDEIKQRYIGLEKKFIGEVVYANEVTLETDWVEHNFPEDFLAIVRNKRQTDRQKFVKVPIGKAGPTLSPDHILCNPKIAYLQKGIDNCVFASLASIIHYLGYLDLFIRIIEFEIGFNGNSLNEKYDKIMGIINNQLYRFKCKKFNSTYMLQRLRNPHKINLLEIAKENPNTIYHVVIKGSDCSSNHCITVYNHYIFDGNYTHALNLCQNELNNCIDSEYIGIDSGYSHSLIV
jgi:hypothetical protein